jgi:hypothetical protein
MALPAPATPTKTAPKAVVQVIPFTRAARKKSRLAAQPASIVLSANVQAFAPIQLPAAGFLRKLRISVVGTTAANAAAVTFTADAPFNLLQQIQVLSPNGDTIINTIDGFSLYCINKYGAHATGKVDPLANPSFSMVTGVGAGVGGSFAFEVTIPFETDSRDAFTALQNMAANQSYLLQLSLNNLVAIYGVAPTTAPTVAVTITMDYWSAPAPFNADGIMQASFPIGNGSVSLIQTQTPAIVAASQQNIQLVNVGNVIRYVILILRTAGGVRTETDWPNVTNWYLNNDPLYYKLKTQWRNQMAQEYPFSAGVTAAPTLNAIDQGVFVLVDFMNDGGSGDAQVDGASNRDLYLVTASSTAFNVEAVNWGAAAGQLFVIQHVIRPISAGALYAPQFS